VGGVSATSGYLIAKNQTTYTAFRGTETKKYSTQTCHIEGQDRRPLVRIVAIVFGFLGLTAFALRCFARLYIAAQSWGTDDYIICAAVAVMIPLQVISIPRTHPQYHQLTCSRKLTPDKVSQHGLGLDMWNVSHDSITSILYVSSSPPPCPKRLVC